LLFVGRVIRSKGVRDAVRALAKLTDCDRLMFDVVGDGDDLAACKSEAEELGVSGLVTFHGRLPRNDIDAFYARADVFVFPSFREPSGNVVLEAMSYGLAMVVADRGGPGFVVDEACGFRVPVADPQQFADGIAACIRRLAAEPRLVESMGAAAREKIRQKFLWDAKVERLEEIYRSVLASPETAARVAACSA
jgi:glycosyltransferase involved in cell wall biosynthesis